VNLWSTPTDRAILHGLSERLGINQTAVLRLALRTLAAQQNFPLPDAGVPLPERASPEQQAT